LLNKKELSETAAELVTRHGEGCSVEQAKELIKEKEEAEEEQEDEKLKQIGKEKPKLTEEEQTKRLLTADLATKPQHLRAFTGPESPLLLAVIIRAAQSSIVIPGCSLG
jgi:hypothetical protein